MDELRKYLNETLGLKIEYGEWLPDANLPLFLSRSASYARCVFEGIAFVAAKMENEDGLPDIKRVHNQLGRYTDLPVVIVSETLDARQRKALVVQGVPFVVPGVQAFLPFLAFAATSREPRRYRRGGRLSSRAQAAFVTLVAHPEVESAAELREVAGLTPSDASRALAELDEQGLVVRSKSGRSMPLAWEGKGDFCPGEAQCRWCKAAAVCRAHRDYQMEIARREFADPPMLSPEEISDVLNRLPALQAWAKKVSEYALKAATSGEVTFPGYKVVEGRSNRKYTDEDAIAAALRKAGYKVADIYKPRELLGLTAMEKLVGKKRFGELAGAYITKPAGDPTLVPESDSRPPLDPAAEAAEDFAEG